MYHDLCGLEGTFPGCGWTTGYRSSGDVSSSPRGGVLEAGWLFLSGMRKTSLQSCGHQVGRNLSYCRQDFVRCGVPAIYNNGYWVVWGWALRAGNSGGWYWSLHQFDHFTRILNLRLPRCCCFLTARIYHFPYMHTLNVREYLGLGWIRNCYSGIWGLLNLKAKGCLYLY